MPYCSQGCFSDDQLFIVVQPDQRFFATDCAVLSMVREDQQEAATSAPAASSSAASASGEPNDNWLPSDVTQRPHNPGRGGIAEAEGGKYADPTPELLDLLRLRKQAKQWTEHRAEGQGEFIWFTHNSSPCYLDCAGCCKNFCTEDEYKTLKRHSGKEWRKDMWSAGDMGIMLTAKFARHFMHVLA